MNQATSTGGLQTPDPRLKDFIVRLMGRENLSRAEASALLDALLNGDATDGQIAAALVALKLKGETVDELAGLAEGMRARAVRIRSRHKRFIDTAGTGSSSAKCFNVSTAAAFVIAGAGLPVAKHGNRAASSNCGSADVLSALGVNVSAAPEISERCLNEVGICFMFAPLYHRATARVAGIRRQLGVQTTFNLLGPLTNPAGAPRQIIGVSKRDYVQPLARALLLLGTEHSWVVHGEDGLDEITVSGATFVSEVSEGRVRSLKIEPGDFGISPGPVESFRGGDAEANAKIIRDVLSGQRKEAARDLVLLNAAAALHVGGAVADVRAGVQMAELSIDSGQASQKLAALIELTK